jgi:hypothetical protein
LGKIENEKTMNLCVHFDEDGENDSRQRESERDR